MLFEDYLLKKNRSEGVLPVLVLVTHQHHTIFPRQDVSMFPEAHNPRPPRLWAFGSFISRVPHCLAQEQQLGSTRLLLFVLPATSTEQRLLNTYLFLSKLSGLTWGLEVLISHSYQHKLNSDCSAHFQHITFLLVTPWKRTACMFAH